MTFCDRLRAKTGTLTSMRRALLSATTLALAASHLSACDDQRTPTDASSSDAPPLDAALPDAPGLDAPFPDAFVAPMADAYSVDAPSEMRLASGVTIDGLALFQGVRVQLAASGAVSSSRNAPVVAARAAIVRAYLSATTYPRTVQGELEVREGARVVGVHTASVTLTSASSDGAPSSVLAFDVPASEVTPTASIAVRLVDPSGESPGASHPARLPRDGTPLPLQAQDDARGLHLVLVPFRWDSDGSHRLPDVSEAWQARVRALLTSLYPIVDLQIDVHEPVPWSGGLTWGGSVDFGAINAELIDLRVADGASPRAYYYGVVAPDVSLAAYCGRSCVTGQSYVADSPGDASYRVGSGADFGTENSAWTLAHEVGHELGRYHAPCSTSGADADYPYRGGDIGVWGLDQRSRTFLAPGDTTDFMGYCDPQWISDYTWSAIFDRTLAVSALALSTPPSPALLVRLVDGHAIVIGTRTLPLPHAHQTTPFVFLDAAGHTRLRGEAPTVLQSHTTERLVVMPRAPSDATQLLVDGIAVPL